VITVRGPGVGERACPGPQVMIIGRFEGRAADVVGTDQPCGPPFETDREAAVWWHPVPECLEIGLVRSWILAVSGERGKVLPGTSRAARWSSATSVPMRRMYPAAWRAHDCISRCGCDTRPWRRRGGAVAVTPTGA